MEYCIHDFKFIHSVTSVGQKGCVWGGGGGGWGQLLRF